MRSRAGWNASLSLAGSGSTLEGVGRLVDGGDFGDTYNYAPPSDDELVDTPTSISTGVASGGPLVGEILIERRYLWPASVNDLGTARATERLATDVTTRVELRIGEPFVRVVVAFDNRSRDHRLRFHIPVPAADGTAAEGQFAVVQRGTTVEGGRGETAVPVFPARGFVHAAGCSVLLDHVTEYELLGSQELALTVLRSVGLISRNFNRYREDPAGPEIEVPGAQGIGPRAFAFGLYPHAGSWDEGDVLAQMEVYRHPFRSAPGTALPGELAPVRTRGLEVAGDGVVLSSLRRRGEWLELRLVAEVPCAVVATVRGPFDKARSANLLGRPREELALARRGELTVELGPWEIRTIQLRNDHP